MTAWTLTAVALMPPLLLAVIVAGRGAPAGRLVAVQIAGTVGILLMLALTFVDDQASSVDLALAVALLAFPAALLFALFEERWL